MLSLPALSLSQGRSISSKALWAADQETDVCELSCKMLKVNKLPAMSHIL